MNRSSQMWRVRFLESNPWRLGWSPHSRSKRPAPSLFAQRAQYGTSALCVVFTNGSEPFRCPSHVSVAAGAERPIPVPLVAQHVPCSCCRDDCADRADDDRTCASEIGDLRAGDCPVGEQFVEWFLGDQGDRDRGRTDEEPRAAREKMSRTKHATGVGEGRVDDDRRRSAHRSDRTCRNRQHRAGDARGGGVVPGSNLVRYPDASHSGRQEAGLQPEVARTGQLNPRLGRHGVHSSHLQSGGVSPGTQTGPSGEGPVGRVVEIEVDSILQC
jgi:hypothetical protein